MRFTLVIFSTYKLLVRSVNVLKLAQSLSAFINSLTLVSRLPKSGVSSKKILLIIHLLIKRMMYLYLFRLLANSFFYPLKWQAKVFSLLVKLSLT